MGIRVLIVDDEPMARESMRDLVAQYKDFTHVVEAEGGKEALTAIRREPFDLVFLDVDMPRVNGLDVAREIAKLPEPPVVVFVTAYDEYALRAFEVNALDYLLKPVENGRFEQAIARARTYLTERSLFRGKLESLQQFLRTGRGTDKLPCYVRHGGVDKVLIDTQDVDYIYTEREEVRVHAKGKEFFMKTTLRELEGRLDTDRFKRTHKSYVVNIDHVSKISPMFSGNYVITMDGDDNLRVPLSRRYARQLKPLLR